MSFLFFDIRYLVGQPSPVDIMIFPSFCQSEFYVYVESYDRVAKDRSMRRRRFKRLRTDLHELRNRKNITMKASSVLRDSILESSQAKILKLKKPYNKSIQRTR